MTPPEAQGHSRREFLIRVGLIGAAMVFVDAGELEFASSPAEGAASSPTALAPLFDALAADTINGLVAFVVPGPDAYSVAQGVHDTAPGGLDADGTAFMLNALDNFYPVPQEPLRMLVQALATGINANLPSAPPAAAARRAGRASSTLALAALLPGRRRSPLSLLVALLLNFVATLVDPDGGHGDLPLTVLPPDFAEKTQAFAAAWRRRPSDVAASIDGNLTEPVKRLDLRPDRVPGRRAAGVRCLRLLQRVRRVRPDHADSHRNTGRLDAVEATSRWRRTTDRWRAGTSSRGIWAARPQASE